ncbi:MAG TPA: DUF1475 family protein [Bryobacteraceae bacterium]|nr:DUF1475 family protein [Bryobacteraceae bacterium]
MKVSLQILFAAIFTWMTVMTIRTSLAVSLWEAWPSYAANQWAVATLCDAYFGFLTFYIWVVYKERSIWTRILWFVLVMGLGNIAMSLYVSLQLMRLRADDPVESILWRRA